ncbi:Peptidyl-prolyl cis-trans isomerase (rotamase)-cyclophilin family [Flavobacterium fluvii]|uniref:Peptidyl-prolyl cis-trans isomerase n=1 Tax=Flavobacterium fluvii TaxID=468056 RepID=A0A1M5NP14_9FLAO|nr:peptidylprolyl isomerase [Flavobacterium fluvii]SHG91185.1 Peptidyl-prolyl cis-trans isomerase (rotamase)-cyclophilin family [Flavobacterium fluvii]
MQIKNLGILLILILVIGCTKTVYKPKWVHETAPDTFVTRFETSKGNFDVQIHREASPKAVDRFYQLVQRRFFDQTVFYRVVPNFVAQFGIIDSTKTALWKENKIPDEPVRESNLKGAISYARVGKESRHDHLFINLKNNQRLDTVMANGVKGYPPFGTVIKGMDVVESLYSGYGNETMAKVDSLNYTQLLQAFPKLDLINKVYILKNK